MDQCTTKSVQSTGERSSRLVDRDLPDNQRNDGWTKTASESKATTTGRGAFGNRLMRK